MATGRWRGPRSWPPGSSASQPSSTDDRDRIVLAYRLAFGRQPEPDEIAEAMAFIDRQANLLPHSARRSNTAADHDALVDFCHVLLNSNEFLYVD